MCKGVVGLLVAILLQNYPGIRQWKKTDNRLRPDRIVAGHEFNISLLIKTTNDKRKCWKKKKKKKEKTPKNESHTKVSLWSVF